jgi:hypothetical protein
MSTVTDDVRERIALAFKTSHSIRDAARKAGVSFNTAKRYAPAMTPGVVMQLDPRLVRLDGGTQIRVTTNEAKVQEYAERMREGVPFDNPPIVVYFDGRDYWPGDGHHRGLAAIAAGRETIAADVRRGSIRDAILHAAGANAEHGLPRSIADRHRAVRTVMADPDWRARYSNREIAAICRVSHTLVNRLAADQSGSTSTPAPANGRVATRGNGVPQSYEDPSSPDFDEPSNVQADPAPLPVPPPKAGRGEWKGEWEETPGTDEPETPAPPPTDAEYLESLPARLKLSDDVRDRFDAEALLFRDLGDIRERYAAESRGMVKRAVKAGKGHHGPLISLHYRYLALNDPSRWTACEPCEGSGKDDLLGKCPACRGHGYHA